MLSFRHLFKTLSAEAETGRAAQAILEPGEIVVASNSEAKGDPTQTRPPHRHVQIETSMELQGAPRDVWVYPGPTRILLSHLPPIQLRATLPPGYPLEKPPEVQLRSSWEISESWLENLEQELQSSTSLPADDLDKSRVLRPHLSLIDQNGPRMPAYLI